MVYETAEGASLAAQSIAISEHLQNLPSSASGFGAAPGGAIWK
jgi:hypothetical protein